MGCTRCGQQRQAVKDAMKRGKPVQAAKQLAKGAGMMTGIIPKDAMPRPGNKR